MYDHVKEFKDKLIDILSEIQSTGVIDETGKIALCRFYLPLLLLYFDIIISYNKSEVYSEF